MADSTKVTLILELQNRVGGPAGDAAGALGQTAEAARTAAERLVDSAEAMGKAKAQDQAMAAALGVSVGEYRALQGQLEATAAAQQSERDAAVASLAALGAVGDPVAQLNQAFEKQRIEIERLRAASGDMEAADKALAAAQKKLGEDIKKTTGEGGEGLKDFGDKAQKASQGLGVISPAAGQAANSIADLTELFTLMANPIGIAVGAMALITGVTVGLVAGLGAAVFASDEALKSLEGFKKIRSDFYPGVPKETIASIDAVNASVTAMKSIWDKAVVTLGGSVAPAFERVANVMVGLALTGEVAFERFLEGRSIFHDLAVFVTTQFVNALTAPLKPLQWLVQVLGWLYTATGQELPSGIASAIDSFSNLQQTIAETAVSYYENAAASGVLGSTWDDLAAKGAKFIGIQQRATKAMEADTKATNESVNHFASLERQVDALSAALEGIDYSAIEDDATALADAQGVLDDLLGKTPSHLDAVNGAMSALVGNYMDGKMSAEAYAQSLDILYEAQAKAMEMDAADTKARALKKVGDTANTVVSASTSISGLVKLDPTGISSAVVGGLQGLGAMKDGGIFKEAQGLLSGAIDGLRSIPSMIGPFLMDILTNLVPKLIGSIGDTVAALAGQVDDIIIGAVRSVPGIIESLFEALPDILESVWLLMPTLILSAMEMLLDPKFWVSMGKALIGGLFDALKELIGVKREDGTGKGPLGLFGSAQEGGKIANLFSHPKEDGSYASGIDYVRKDGLYQLHQGERVMNPADAARSSAGGSVNFYISGVIASNVEELVRVLRKHLGSTGRGLSFG